MASFGGERVNFLLVHRRTTRHVGVNGKNEVKLQGCYLYVFDSVFSHSHQSA